MHYPFRRKGGISMTCTKDYRGHIEYTFHAFCKVVIRNATITAARARSRKYKKRNIPWIPHRRKVLPFRYDRRIFHSTLWRIPYHDMRSDNHSHQWETCRRPALPAGKEPGNYFPLFFWALQTVGNRGNVRTLPEYNRISNPQGVEAPAERNGGAFT